jgi:hypothetical protein
VRISFFSRKVSYLFYQHAYYIPQGQLERSANGTREELLVHLTCLSKHKFLLLFISRDSLLDVVVTSQAVFVLFICCQNVVCCHLLPDSNFTSSKFVNREVLFKTPEFMKYGRVSDILPDMDGIYSGPYTVLVGNVYFSLQVQTPTTGLVFIPLMLIIRWSARDTFYFFL